MKLTFLVLTVLVLADQSGEIQFTGSTPANANEVRKFLNIPLSNSVDFIRWKITMGDDQFFLKCNYGIGQPNTSGFIKGGKWVEMNGLIRREKNYLFLQSGDKSLVLLKLNNGLVHLLSAEKTLLAGNGGWSYTLNGVNTSPSDQVNSFVKQVILKDTISFQGRTPCWQFPLVHSSANCIKKKWLIVFYADAKTNQPTTYYLNGNSRGEGGTRGKWKIATGKDGRIIYQLFSETESHPLELLVLDENVLAFMDKDRKLLVGNEDFSFTLSKR